MRLHEQSIHIRLARTLWPALLGLAAAAPPAASAMPDVPAAAPAAASDDGTGDADAQPPRTPPDATYEECLRAILSRSLPDWERDGELPAGSRELFAQVVASEAFAHAEAGPFDVYVYREADLESERAAHDLAEDAAEGLQPLAALMERYFPRDDGLVSGQRFPIVLMRGRDTLVGPFPQVVALLDWCESDYTNWTKDNGTLWTRELIEGPVVRTWEVQLFNLAHGELGVAGAAFFDHGLGYYTISHLVNRLLRLGSWGTVVPPWLSNGLVDELDIQAYGEAWVGGDWFKTTTAGWYRPGWSGFLPQGMAPPPPPTGPPADLAVTVEKTGDAWAHRANSPERHWHELAADRDSEAPASFTYMAEHESFLPRDRALARCGMHLLLELAAPQDPGQGLLALLDRRPVVPENGMPDAEPLPVLVARALGGVASVEECEQRPVGDVVTSLGHERIAKRLRELGAEGMLEVPDHREQAQWLYDQWEIDADTRFAIWEQILTAEYVQQLHEWKLVGEALDRATAAALEASKTYPSKERTKARVADAFWKAVHDER